MYFFSDSMFTTLNQIICKNKSIMGQLDMFKNFAFETEISVMGHGINAKMNEIYRPLGIFSRMRNHKW